MMVHLEDAALARGAMVGAVRLPRLTLLAKPYLAIALDGERGRLRSVLRREEAIAVVVGSRAGVREDRSRV